MGLSKNGVSTINTPRQFATEAFYSLTLHRDMLEWHYRDSKGKLHFGIARTIHRARLAAQRASNETID